MIFFIFYPLMLLKKLSKIVKKNIMLNATNKNKNNKTFAMKKKLIFHHRVGKWFCNGNFLWGKFM